MARCMVGLAGLALVLTVVGGAQAATGPWLTDLDQALTAAAAAGTPVLVDFSGSDWCGWCQRLDREVFTTAAFLDWAPKNVVPCVLDFPRDKTLVAPAQRLKNQAAWDRYGATGYPTVLLLDKDGAVLGRTGYRPGGPEVYVRHLSGLLEFAAAWPATLGALGSLEGTAKASAAAELLGRLDEDDRERRLVVFRTIFAADPTNTSGKRPLAAYTMALAAEGQSEAQQAETYLASVNGTDPERHYSKLLAERARLALRRFVVAVQAEPSTATSTAAPADWPPVKAAVADLRARSELAMTVVDDPKGRLLLHLYRAVAQGCARETTASEADFAAAARAGAPPPQVQGFRGFVQNALREP